MRPSRAISDGVVLARPLLWATKKSARLSCALAGCSISPTTKPTMIPHSAQRRSDVARAARSVLPQSSRGIARSAALLADDRELLRGDEPFGLEAVRRPEHRRAHFAALRRLPIALLRRVVRAAVGASGAGLRNFSFVHCDAIARAIKHGRGGRYHAGATTVVLSSGKLVVETGARMRLSLPPGRRPHTPARLVARRPGERLRFSLHKRAAEERRDAVCSGSIPRAALGGQRAPTLRAPREGDRCVPSGHRRPVSLARFLGKAGVPLSRRSVSWRSSVPEVASPRCWGGASWSHLSLSREVRILRCGLVGGRYLRKTRNMRQLESAVELGDVIFSEQDIATQSRGSATKSERATRTPARCGRHPQRRSDLHRRLDPRARRLPLDRRLHGGQFVRDRSHDEHRRAHS